MRCSKRIVIGTCPSYKVSSTQSQNRPLSSLYWVRCRLLSDGLYLGIQSLEAELGVWQPWHHNMRTSTCNQSLMCCFGITPGPSRLSTVATPVFLKILRVNINTLYLFHFHLGWCYWHSRISYAAACHLQVTCSVEGVLAYAIACMFSKPNFWFWYSAARWDTVPDLNSNTQIRKIPRLKPWQAVVWTFVDTNRQLWGEEDYYPPLLETTDFHLATGNAGTASYIDPLASNFDSESYPWVAIELRDQLTIPSLEQNSFRWKSS